MTNNNEQLKNTTVYISDSVNTKREFFLTHKTYQLNFRKDMLIKLRKSIIENEQLLVEALQKDLGKPLLEIYTTEIGIVLREINETIKKFKKWVKPLKVRGDMFSFPSKNYIVKEPYGVALIIGPWNFPVNLTLIPLVGAIASGNCVVLKPSELTPNTSSAIRKVIEQAFTQDYISVIEGDASVSESLLNEKFDKIFFTGSPQIGKIVMSKAANNLTSTTLELGGKSPCVIDKTKRLDLAVKRIAIGKFINSGQICVAPDYLLVHESQKELLYQLFRKTIKEFYGDNPQTSKDFSRIVNQTHFNRILKFLDDGEIVVGGTYDQNDLYISPTILEIQDINAPIMNNEIFGPILPVITYHNYNEIINIISKNPDPLALYIFSENNTFVEKLIQDVPSGGVCINDTIMHITNNNLPFGGRNNSGLGNYHGKYSIDTFSHSKSIMKRSSMIDIKFKYPPYKNSHKLIRNLFIKD